MALGPYATFILSSYALVTIVVTGLIAWVVLDYKRQKAELNDLEAGGVTRRSQKTDSDS